MDGDACLPCGDSGWFKEAAELPDMPDVFANLNTIYRMLVHKKTIVSVAYVSRNAQATPQFGGDLNENIGLMRGGPRDQLIERPWSGMHGMLVHRSVFEDIIKTQGEEIRMKPGGIGTRFNYEYGFFNPLNGEIPGDDIPFATRAARAGHKTFVDLAVQAAHVGDRAYSFKDL